MGSSQMVSVIAAASASLAIAFSAPGGSAVAQTAPSAPVDRKVDLHATLPGLAPLEASAPSDGASKLTRDQRKEDALQARRQGALKPAGEGAEGRATPVTQDGFNSPTPPVTTTSMSPAPVPVTGAIPAAALPTPSVASAAASSPGRLYKATTKKTKKRPSAPASSASALPQGMRHGVTRTTTIPSLIANTCWLQPLGRTPDLLPAPRLTSLTLCGEFYGT